MPPSLSRLFDFTADDLAENQRGQLSERQRRKLLQDLRKSVVDQMATLLTLPLVALMIVAYFFIVPSLGNSLGALILVVIGVSIAGIIAVGSAIWRITRWGIKRLIQRRSFDRWLRRRIPRYNHSFAIIERGNIYAKSGVITVESDGEHEYVMLNGEAVQANVSAEQDERLWKLTPEQAYTLYLVEETNWIVAVETQS